jgi:hypothetical protein
MNRIAEPFRSLLDDIREATQTLANCAVKGKLKPDGTRMPEPAKDTRKIIIDHVFPPIPLRHFDYRAYHVGDEELPARHGYGATEAAALAELKLLDEDWADSLTDEQERLWAEQP